VTGVPGEGAAPALSVVVVSLGSARALGEVLSALAAQRGVPPLEVVVPADHRVQATLRDTGAAAVTARVVPVDGTVSPWALRAAGVRAARAPIVATLEDCALPAPDWAARILAAHAGTDAAVGGPVAKRTPDGAVGWAMYFLDYGRYAPPLPSRSATYLSACNVSYKRAALDRVRHAWGETMHETDVHWALMAKGETMRLDEGALVHLRRELDLAGARDELRTHGALFGSGRAATMSAAGRAARLVAAPLLPVVMVAKSAAPLLRAPSLLPAWLRALPMTMLLAVSWSAGELRGYLGAGSPVRSAT
jgi:hypothetical protein